LGSVMAKQPELLAKNEGDGIRRVARSGIYYKLDILGGRSRVGLELTRRSVILPNGHQLA
jgi:hypothetical protein